MAINGNDSGINDDAHWVQSVRTEVPEGRICCEVRGYSLLGLNTITHEKPFEFPY